MNDFDPTTEALQCEDYLRSALESDVRLLRSERLTASTRAAPWRLDVEIGGTRRSYVLRTDSRRIEHEYHVLRAMESVAIPTPRAYGWDPDGEALGVRCFLSDFIDGESLLPPMLAGEPWATALYVDTACALQALTRNQLASIDFGPGETAADFLEAAYGFFAAHPDSLAEAVYRELKDTMPELPPVRFSNGDLWPDNILVRDGELVAVIDFTNAGFSDPLYEFLLPFFLREGLQGHGIEERYCHRMRIDPAGLPWYRGLELLDTWHWVAKTGEPFEHHTATSIPEALKSWLEAGHHRS